MNLFQDLCAEKVLHCLIVDYSWGSYNLKATFQNLLEKTMIPHMYLSFISSKKQKCVTKETTIDLYKGQDNFYKQSVGETLEEFMTLGRFLD